MDEEEYGGSFCWTSDFDVSTVTRSLQLGEFESVYLFLYSAL